MWKHFPLYSDLLESIRVIFPKISHAVFHKSFEIWEIEKKKCVFLEWCSRQFKQAKEMASPYNALQIYV